MTDGIEVGSLPSGAAAPLTHTDPPPADHRPAVYREGDVWVVRASAMGGCVRSLVAARMGYSPVEPKDAALLRMNEGVIHEPHILKHVAETYELSGAGAQEEVNLPVAGGRILIRGHMDEVALGNLRTGRDQGHSRVVEAKAMGKSTFDKWISSGKKGTRWEEFRRYAYQISVYMHALNTEKGLFAIKNRDTGEIQLFELEKPPISLADIKARALKVTTLTDLPSCDPVQYLCDFFYIHEEVEMFPTRDQDEALDELAKIYDEARFELNVAEAKKKEAAKQLAAALGDRPSVTTEDWKVTLVTTTKRSPDMSSLRRDHAELLEEYEREVTYSYPRVTRQEKEVEEDGS